MSIIIRKVSKSKSNNRLRNIVEDKYKHKMELRKETSRVRKKHFVSIEKSAASNKNSALLSKPD